MRGQRRTSAAPGEGWGPARACAVAGLPRAGRAEQQSRGGRLQTPLWPRGERGPAMRPLDDTGAAKRQESGLPLMDIPSPGSRQEPAAAEVVETPGPGGCWQCPSSPCGSRAQQGECGARTLARVSPMGEPRGAPVGGNPRSRGRGAAHGGPRLSLPPCWKLRNTVALSPAGGGCGLERSSPLRPSQRKDRRKFLIGLEPIWGSQTVPIIKVLWAGSGSPIAVRCALREVGGQ